MHGSLRISDLVVIYKNNHPEGQRITVSFLIQITSAFKQTPHSLTDSFSPSSFFRKGSCQK